MDHSRVPGRGVCVQARPVRHLGRDHTGKTYRACVFHCFRAGRPARRIFPWAGSTGRATPHLHQLKVGDTFTFRKVAKGRFTLDTQSGRTNHLLLSTVTGVAPFVSYIRSLRKDWKEGRFPGQHKLYLIDEASRSWEFGYRQEIEPIAAEAPWLKYVTTVSRPWEDTAWKGEVGRVDDLLRKYTDLWDLAPESTTAYLCGHPSMIEDCKGILHRRGWQKENMREEIYFIPSKQT